MNYDQKILNAVVEAEAVPLPDTFTLSSGVILRAKRVAPLRIDAIQRQFKEPEVPVITLDDGRKVENPDHPKYQEDVKRVNEDRTNAVLDAFMMFGTEVVSVPDTLRSVDNDEWIEEMALVGISVPKDHKLARYLAWLRYEALVNPEPDLMLISQQVMKKLAISEENIAAAMDSFRSETARDTDPELLPETP